MMTNKVYMNPQGSPFIATGRPVSRRHFLRGAGVMVALPWLEAMLPTFVRGQGTAAAAQRLKPRRMLAVLNNVGFIPKNFFPPTEGRDYVFSPYLELIKEHRADFTVFSNVSLPGVANGTASERSWLTGAATSPGRTFRNTVSLDQVVARHVGELTRFPSLVLAINGRSGLSYSDTGEMIAPLESGAETYRKLFVRGSASEMAAVRQQLQTGQSILDVVKDQATDMGRTVGAEDRERLDQYFTSVRALERKLQAMEAWEGKPKPMVAEPLPTDLAPAQYFEKVALMYGLAVLAFQTDSTRAITLFINSAATPIVAGRFDVQVTEGYLGLAGHKGSPARLAQLQALDREHFRWLNTLLSGLKAIHEDGEKLLDRTQVLWGSNWNDYNAKQSANLPIVFAGGGWKHGQHLAFVPDRKPVTAAYVHKAFARPNGDYPLTNLHLSMLHRIGIAAEKFSNSTGKMEGLEMS